MNNAFEPTEHPLKAEVKTKGVPLWKIRRALGGLPSEGTLSRMLTGIDPMPPTMEKRIVKVLEQVGGA